MTPRIRLAGPDDLPGAADTLAAAFADYAWTRYVIPEDHYAERLRTLHGDRIGRLDTGGDTGTDSPPDTRPTAASGEDGLPVWRLETLGVHPSRQGGGIGGALVGFGLGAAALRGARAVILETSDPRNVRLYARYGFATLTRTDGPGRPPVWTMRAELTP